MPAQSIATMSAPVAAGGSLRKSLVCAVGVGMATGCVAAALYIVATAPVGLFLGLAGQQVSRMEGKAFDQALAGKTQVLRGVNGEMAAATGDVITPLPSRAHLSADEVSPAAFGRLSAGDCISLTTASGQKLSFRILGAHQRQDQRNRGDAAIELDVTACAAGSESILRAIIESKTDGKQSAIQRNL